MIIKQLDKIGINHMIVSIYNIYTINVSFYRKSRDFLSFIILYSFDKGGKTSFLNNGK